MKNIVRSFVLFVVVLDIYPSLLLAEDVAPTTLTGTVWAGGGSSVTSSNQVTPKFTSTDKGISVSSCLISPLTQLKKGSQDKGSRTDVFKMQRALYLAGYLKADPNGYFGEATRNAVRSLQKKFELTVTGIVGPYTLAAINDISCGKDMSAIIPPNQDPKPVVPEIKKDISPLFVMESPTKDKPFINNFVFSTNSSGVQTYTTKIQNVDAVSMKASCPPGIIEVKASTGLTKIKIQASDSVCSKEKYLFLADSSSFNSFDRAASQIVFIDREGSPSWFAFDSSTSPSISTVPVTVKSCLQSVCVQKVYTVDVRDFFQVPTSTSLSLSDVRIDDSQNLFFSAANFNGITMKAGCPYNVRAVDDKGTPLSDTATPCSNDKVIVPTTDTVATSSSNTDGIPLKKLGFNFEIKPVNGQSDLFSNVELLVKACSGKQADTIASTTLRCVEKSTFLPVYKK